MHGDQELGEFLVELGVLSAQRLLAAHVEAKKSGKSLKEVLRFNNDVTPEDIARAEAHILGLPFVDLKGKKLDLATLSLIPEPLSRTVNAVAFGTDTKGRILVAALDANVFEQILRLKEGMQVLPHLTDTDSIKHALVEYQRLLGSRYGESIKVHAAAKGDASASALLSTLLSHALLQGATSVHLDPVGNNLVVRYRLGGELHDAMMLPISTQAAVFGRMKELAGLAPLGTLPVEGGFTIQNGAEHASIKFHTIPLHKGERAVLLIERHNDPDFARAGFSLEALGFSGSALERMHHAVGKGSGLILVGGPEKSGKTTLLYTLLDVLNHPTKDLMSAEEEIEWMLDRVSQAKVNPETGFGYKEALRSMTGMHPDIVMIADVKDAETARLAAALALQGTLVLAGVVAEDAVDALQKVHAFGMDHRGTIASVGLRTVPKLPSERVSYRLSKEEITWLDKLVSIDRMYELLHEEGVLQGNNLLDTIVFKRAPYLKETSDPTGLYEVLLATPNMSELLRSGHKRPVLVEEARRAGMRSLFEDGMVKAARGSVSLDDVLRATRSL